MTVHVNFTQHGEITHDDHDSSPISDMICEDSVIFPVRSWIVRLVGPCGVNKHFMVKK